MSSQELQNARPLSPHLSIYKPIPTMMMSIVHRIMDTHGGAVRVENNTDDSDWTSGATVSLLLPSRVVQQLPSDGRGQIVVRAGRMAQPGKRAVPVPVVSEPLAQGDVA